MSQKVTIDQVVGTFTGQLEVLNQSIPGTSSFLTKVDANTVCTGSDVIAEHY